MLYWRIGKTIRARIAAGRIAGQEKGIVDLLSETLITEYGRGFSRRNLFHMTRLADTFENERTVQTLSAQLSWSHFIEVIYLKDPLQRQFYSEMARVERWSVRTMRQKIKGMLYERTAISRMPEEFARQELEALTEDNSRALKAEKSPTTKFLLLNAYIRQLLAKIREALKSRPQESGNVIQVCSKIMARAVQIIDYIKTYGEDDPTGKRDISLDSQQARLLFSGKSKEGVSRRDTIRAMRRAEALWPALTCAHRPNDGRQTMRLTIPREDLECGPEMGYSDLWQRSDRRIALSL
jgi:hypothetical protein